MRFRRFMGFSLIEVLISMLLISFIFLSFDGMQLYSLKEANRVYLFHVAANQIQNMIERLSALQNHDGLSKELTSWNEENKLILPNGYGEVIGEFPNYIITLYWGNKPHSCEKNQIGESGCLIEKISTASRSLS